MNRYLSFLTLMVIGASALVAQSGDFNTFLNSDNGSSLKSFIDEANKFALDNLGAKGDEYKNKLENLVKEELGKKIPNPNPESTEKITKQEYFEANPDKVKLDTGKYFTELRKAWDEMMGEFAKANRDDLKTQYIAQSEDTNLTTVLRADLLGEGVLEKGEFTKYTGALPMDDYLSTFQALNNAYKWNIANPNTSPTPKNNPKTFEPSTSLDKPVPPGWWTRKFSISREGAVWGSSSIYSIMSALQSMQKQTMNNADYGGNYWCWYTGWTGGDWTTLQKELGYFLNKSGVSGQEAYQMCLSQGSTAYMDEYGKSFTPNPEQYYTDLDVGDSKPYNLAFYMGRNTAVSDTTAGTTAEGWTKSKEEQQFSFTTGGVKYCAFAWETRTPIVLDMNGDEKLDASGGDWLVHGLAKNAKLVPFDINGDRFEELVEWLGANDGLLITYTGQEVNGNNLFGDAGGFVDGFEKLTLLDENGDNQLTGKELATLSVWQDRNGNAKVEKGEVTSVTELGITSIAITHNNFVASFVQNGKTKVMWDWHPVSIMVKKSK